MLLRVIDKAGYLGTFQLSQSIKLLIPQLPAPAGWQSPPAPAPRRLAEFCFGIFNVASVAIIIYRNMFQLETVIILRKIFARFGHKTDMKYKSFNLSPILMATSWKTKYMNLELITHFSLQFWLLKPSETTSLSAFLIFNFHFLTKFRQQLQKRLNCSTIYLSTS
jgi:hypothetical protein